MLDPQILTIKALLELSQYFIPLYQRNYAWKEEVIQLLQDIWDKCKQMDSARDYCIGTLIVGKHTMEGNGFEIVDGQQRYTTIALINAVIYRYYNNDCLVPFSNLHLTAREEQEDYITALFQHSEEDLMKEGEGVSNLSKAFKDIDNWLKQKTEDLAPFFSYFYHKVIVVRIGIPDDTDVNHYFEIMNSRGEQLEKHEILKGQLMAKAKAEEKRSGEGEAFNSKFALIWDACSQMDRPVHLSLGVEAREELFGSLYRDIPENGVSRLSHIDKATEGLDIRSIIEGGNHPEWPGSTEDGKDKEQQYPKSIIDFPNFLLQVLKLERDKISLDDKMLLREFEDDLPSPESFINTLLYYRVLFDRYIIKREEANNDFSWSLTTITKKKEGFYFKNSFGNEENEYDEDDFSNKEFVMIQSMLHVSFPGNSYKNWLQRILLFFKRSKDKGEIDGNDFMSEIRQICKDHYSENIRLADSAGTGTPRFIFNYLDLLLWHKYVKTMENNSYRKGENDLLDRLAAIRKRIREFKFSQNNSVEHVAPQNPDKAADRVSELHHFGNLCLISRGANSRYHRLGFQAKKEHFNNKDTTESLKQAVIFTYDSWDDDTIRKHADSMTSLFEEFNLKW